MYKGECVLVSSSSGSIEDLTSSFSFLRESRLVLKPDVLLKRRGKLGLVLLNASWAEVYRHLQQQLNTLYCADNVEGRLSHFLIEEYFEHSSENEYYIAMRTKQEGDEILFSTKGGVHVGDVETEANKILLHVRPLEEGKDEDIYIPDEQINALIKDVTDPEARAVFPCFLRCLYTRFCRLHFAFLEINPFSFDKQNKQFRILDVAAKIDRASDFLCPTAWRGLRPPNPFGRDLTEEELYIR